MNHDEADDFLAHYGKLGMKWGHRRTRAEVQIHKQDRARLKGLDRKAKAVDKNRAIAAREKQYQKVQAARARVGGIFDKHAPNDVRLREARAKYKADRERIGKVAARRSLNKVKDMNYADLQLSRQPGSRTEEVMSAVSAILEVAAVMAK